MLLHVTPTNMIRFYKMQYIVRELCNRWEESQLHFIMKESALSTVLTLVTATIAGKWWSAKGQLYIFSLQHIWGSNNTGSKTHDTTLWEKT